MSEIRQKPGRKGSQKWIQHAVNEAWPSLETPILARLRTATRIEWRSPLAEKGYAEYRDGDALDRVGLAHLRAALDEFWPARGPQWDALGVTDRQQVLLVEAKSHVGELCSPGTAAGERSRGKIEKRLAETAAMLGARAGHAPWSTTFYQLANRLAHLAFLRQQGVDAYLILVNFLNDTAMEGPSTVETWNAAYDVAFHVMGLGRKHRFSRHIVEVFPDVVGRETLGRPPP